MILFHFAVSLSVSFCVVTKSLTEPFAKWNFLRQFILQLTFDEGRVGTLLPVLLPET